MTKKLPDAFVETECCRVFRLSFTATHNGQGERISVNQESGEQVDDDWFSRWMSALVAEQKLLGRRPICASVTFAAFTDKDQEGEHK